jgi:hypothetical protein
VRTLTAEEQQAAAAAMDTITPLEAELVIARGQLYRVLAVQRTVAAMDAAELPVDELVVVEDAGGGVMETRRHRRPDVLALVDRLLGRIGRLELARARIIALRALSPAAGSSAQEFAESVQAFLSAAEEVTCGSGSADAP